MLRCMCYAACANVTLRVQEAEQRKQTEAAQRKADEARREVRGFVLEIESVSGNINV
jgi:hypothetical protein